MHVENYDLTIDSLRSLLLHRQFESDPMRLLQSCVSSGLSAAQSFSGTNLQKFTLRQTKFIEKIVRGEGGGDGETVGGGGLEGDEDRDGGEQGDEEEAEEEVRGGVRRNREFGAGEEEEGLGDGEEEEGIADGRFRPTKSNPTYIAMYASSLIFSKSWQSAIGELTPSSCTDDNV